MTAPLGRPCPNFTGTGKVFLLMLITTGGIGGIDCQVWSDGREHPTHGLKSQLLLLKISAVTAVERPSTSRIFYSYLPKFYTSNFPQKEKRQTLRVTKVLGEVTGNWVPTHP